MMHARFQCLLSILLLSSLPMIAAHAERDIVFGARYYAPPHSKITTYFHIYRINPDGTGKTQLTFGFHDDTEPFWAPDGQSIVFFRDDQFSIVSAKGGTVFSLKANIDGATRGDLHWSPDGRTLAVATNNATHPLVYFIDTHMRTIRTIGGTMSYQWSPDGTKRFIQNADHASVIVGTGETTQILSKNKKATVTDVIWLDSDTLFGLRTKDEEHTTPFTYQLATKHEQPISFKLAAHTDNDLEDPNQVSPVYLMPVPGSTQEILYVWDNSNSTVRPNNDFYRVNSQTGMMTAITQNKQFLTFSPDGLRFCTSPGRDTSPYEKRQTPIKDAADNSATQMKTVWTAPLQIGDSKTGKVHTISKGLVWVKGADWLHAEHKKIP